MKVMKENSPNKFIVVHLNTNSLKNKIEALQFFINRNLDIILLLSETKLDDSFPSAQFMLKNLGLTETQMVEGCYFIFVRIYPPSS